MATSNPLLHTHTHDALAAVQVNPPHALLLTGAAGMGKATIAQWLAGQLLGVDTTSISDHPYVFHIASADGKAISIDAVRTLEHAVSLKAPSRQAVSRLIIMYDAHLLTTEAQNALLKTLEEPPQGTVLLLTSSQQEALLPTIRSRLQTVEVLRPNRDALATLLTSLGATDAEVVTTLALSGGLPGLAVALTQNDQEHPLVAAAHTARELLQQSTFEKLCQVERLAKDKEAARNTVHLLMQMAHAALLTGRSSERWQRILQAAYQTDKALTTNAQPKLALTNLMLNL